MGLETACFILDLKTGCLFIGSLSAIFSLVLVLVISYFAILMFFFIDFQLMVFVLVIMFLVKSFLDIFFICGAAMERAEILWVYFISWSLFFIGLLGCVVTIHATIPPHPFFDNFSTVHVYCLALTYGCLNVYAALLCYNYGRQLGSRVQV